MAKADDNLPAVDQFLLDKACAVADASRKEPDPVKRLLLEQTAMDLWQQPTPPSAPPAMPALNG